MAVQVWTRPLQSISTLYFQAFEKNQFLDKEHNAITIHEVIAYSFPFGFS